MQVNTRRPEFIQNNTKSDRSTRHESQIATRLAVPCWSSWTAAMCGIQATVAHDQPPRVGLELPLMKP
jgi:hypothetical protein